MHISIGHKVIFAILAFDSPFNHFANCDPPAVNHIGDDGPYERSGERADAHRESFLLGFQSAKFEEKLRHCVGAGDEKPKEENCDVSKAF